MVGQQQRLLLKYAAYLELYVYSYKRGLSQISIPKIVLACERSSLTRGKSCKLEDGCKLEEIEQVHVKH